jgi:hypothetical protein
VSVGRRIFYAAMTILSSATGGALVVSDGSRIAAVAMALIALDFVTKLVERGDQ